MSYFRKTIAPFHRNIYSKPHSIHVVAVTLYLVSLSEGIFDFATLTSIYISLGEVLDTIQSFTFESKRRFENLFFFSFPNHTSRLFVLKK